MLAGADSRRKQLKRPFMNSFIMMGLMLLACLTSTFTAERAQKKVQGEEVSAFDKWMQEKMDHFKKRSEEVFGIYEYHAEGWKPTDWKFNGEKVVLLIHGLDDAGYIWRQCTPYLLEKDFEVIKIEYANDDSIDRSTAFLAEQLKKLKKAEIDQLSIVAHSMGGLLSRNVLTHPDYFKGDARGGDEFPAIQRLITVGTPNKGSKFSKMRWMAELREQSVKFIRRETHLFHFKFDGDGEAAIDLYPESPFLKKLNSRKLPEHVDFTIIAGEVSQNTIDAMQEKTESMENDFPGIKRSIKRFRKYWTRKSNELGDGVVSIDSARLEGVDDFQIVQGTHLTIIYSLFSGKMAPALPIIRERLSRDLEPGNEVK